VLLRKATTAKGTRMMCHFHELATKIWLVTFCGSAASFWSFSFWLLLSLQIGNLVGFIPWSGQHKIMQDMPANNLSATTWNMSIWVTVLPLFCYCANVVASPSRAPTCTGDQESRSLKLLVVTILLGRGRIKFFGKRLPASWDHHDGPSFIKSNVRCHVPSSRHQRGTLVRQWPYRQLYSFLFLKMRNCFVNCVRRFGLKNFSVLSVTLTNELPILESVCHYEKPKFWLMTKT